METIRYYLIDATHGTFNSVLQALNGLHRAALPNNYLSVTYNNYMTEALVKVVSDSPASIGVARIRTFTEIDHADAVSMINTDPAWMDSNKTTEQIVAISAATITHKNL